MRAEKGRGYSAKCNLGCDLSQDVRSRSGPTCSRPLCLSLLLLMCFYYIYVLGVYKSLFLFSGIHSFIYHPANTYGELFACQSLETS